MVYITRDLISEVATRRGPLPNFSGGNSTTLQAAAQYQEVWDTLNRYLTAQLMSLKTVQIKNIFQVGWVVRKTDSNNGGDRPLIDRPYFQLLSSFAEKFTLINSNSRVPDSDLTRVELMNPIKAAMSYSRGISRDAFYQGVYHLFQHLGVVLMRGLEARIEFEIGKMRCTSHHVSFTFSSEVVDFARRSKEAQLAAASAGTPRPGLSKLTSPRAPFGVTPGVDYTNRSSNRPGGPAIILGTEMNYKPSRDFDVDEHEALNEENLTDFDRAIAQREKEYTDSHASQPWSSGVSVISVGSYRPGAANLSKSPVRSPFAPANNTPGLPTSSARSTLGSKISPRPNPLLGVSETEANSLAKTSSEFYSTLLKEMEEEGINDLNLQTLIRQQELDIPAFGPTLPGGYAEEDKVLLNKIQMMRTLYGDAALVRTLNDRKKKIATFRNATMKLQTATMNGGSVPVDTMLDVAASCPNPTISDPNNLGVPSNDILIPLREYLLSNDFESAAALMSSTHPDRGGVIGVGMTDAQKATLMDAKERALFKRGVEWATSTRLEEEEMKVLTDRELRETAKQKAWFAAERSNAEVINYQKDEQLRRKREETRTRLHHDGKEGGISLPIDANEPDYAAKKAQQEQMLNEQMGELTAQRREAKEMEDALNRDAEVQCQTSIVRDRMLLNAKTQLQRRELVGAWQEQIDIKQTDPSLTPRHKIQRPDQTLGVYTKLFMNHNNTSPLHGTTTATGEVLNANTVGVSEMYADFNHGQTAANNVFSSHAPDLLSARNPPRKKANLASAVPPLVFYDTTTNQTAPPSSITPRPPTSARTPVPPTSARLVQKEANMDDGDASCISLPMSHASARARRAPPRLGAAMTLEKQRELLAAKRR